MKRRALSAPLAMVLQVAGNCGEPCMKASLVCRRTYNLHTSAAACNTINKSPGPAKDSGAVSGLPVRAARQSSQRANRSHHANSGLPSLYAHVYMCPCSPDQPPTSPNRHVSSQNKQCGNPSMTLLPTSLTAARYAQSNPAEATFSICLPFGPHTLQTTPVTLHVVTRHWIKQLECETIALKNIEATDASQLRLPKASAH